MKTFHKTLIVASLALTLTFALNLEDAQARGSHGGGSHGGGSHGGGSRGGSTAAAAMVDQVVVDQPGWV